MSLMHAPAEYVPFDHPAIRYPMLASEKLNGWRMFCMAGQLFTRTFRPFRNRNLAAHFRELSDLALRDMFCLDCELYDPSLSLPELQAILESPTAAIPATLGAYVFDALSAGAWIGGRAPRADRRYDLYTRWISANHPTHVIAHNQRLVASAMEAESMYRAILERGGEGLMMKSPRAGYRQKRLTIRDGVLFRFKPEPLSAPQS